MENVEPVLVIRAPPKFNEVAIIATKDILPSGELYMSYDGKYFADPDHPLELRQLAAKRYPPWAPFILNAAGEGECQHTECIVRRHPHINARIDPLENDEDPDISTIDLRCSQPVSHVPATHTLDYLPSPYDVPLPPEEKETG